jgi:ATP-dependent DNA helicase RecG
MTGDIPGRENLTVEFKSDRDRLKDRILIAAVVSMANAEGGERMTLG